MFVADAIDDAVGIDGTVVAAGVVGAWAFVACVDAGGLTAAAAAAAYLIGNGAAVRGCGCGGGFGLRMDIGETEGLEADNEMVRV